QLPGSSQSYAAWCTKDSYQALHPKASKLATLLRIGGQSIPKMLWRQWLRFVMGTFTSSQIWHHYKTLT
ncbi:hypothetical protein JG688_00012081, partial [Phytophthora aleatoria]